MPGVYFEISPAGRKRWFWKHYPEGKEFRMTLGSYPAISLTAARKAGALCVRNKLAYLSARTRFASPGISNRVCVPRPSRISTAPAARMI